MVAVEQGAGPVASAQARWWAINGLGLYVVLMYGIAYYAVTTAAPEMAVELGVSVSTVFGLLTVGLLITAALAPLFGGWTDRFGAANILLVGAALRAGVLALVALAPNVVTFALALIVLQILGQLTEYDATFAAAVDLSIDRARTSMSQITMWGGVASTVFWPATAFLLSHMTWRDMLLVYAAAIGLVCMPIALCLRTLPRVTLGELAPSPAATLTSKPLHADRAAPPFLLVAAAFALGGVAYNLPVLMLPVLNGLGLGASAVVVGMLFGPSQTAGRLFDMVLGARVHPITVAVIASVMVAVSFAILAIGGVSSALVFSVLFGAGAGVGYVVRGSVMLALYGTTDYALWLGRLGAVRLIVTAMTPLGLSLVLETFGAQEVVLACASAAALSLACFIVLARRAA